MATNFPRNRHGNSLYRNNRGNAGHGNSNGSSSGSGHGNGNGSGSGYGNGNGGGFGYGYGYEQRTASAKEQVYEILHVLFKRWRQIALIFAIIFIPFLLLTTVLTRTTYVATAKVNISTDRANLTVQPTDSDTLNMMKLNESIVNSEVHLIRSRDMLSRVANDLAEQRAGGIVGLANAAGDDAALGRKALELENRIKVTPIRASNVIQIEYVDTDEKWAAQVVREVLDEYLTYHAEVHGPKDLSKFWREQTKGLENDLRQSEESLREYALKEGLVAPGAEIQNLIKAVGDMENELRLNNGKVIGAEEKLRIVREQLAEQPALVKRAQLLEVNPIVKQLSGHLIDRQVDRVSLLRKYTDEDRHVRDNADEINEIQGQLDQAVRDQPTVVSQQIFRSNPIYDSRLTELLDTEAQLKEQRARKLALEEDLSRSRRSVIQLKQRALEFDRLEQDVVQRRASLELYAKREHEARIMDLMDQEKLVNVEIVQRPNLPLRKANESKNSLALALISGLAVSLAWGFGAEYLNRTLRFDRDVEQQIGLPVLGGVKESSHA